MSIIITIHIFPVMYFNSLKDSVGDEKYNQPHQGHNHTHSGGNADYQLEARR